MLNAVYLRQSSYIEVILQLLPVVFSYRTLQNTEFSVSDHINFVDSANIGDYVVPPLAITFISDIDRQAGTELFSPRQKNVKKCVSYKISIVDLDACISK